MRWRSSSSAAAVPGTSRTRLVIFSFRILNDLRQSHGKLVIGLICEMAVRQISARVVGGNNRMRAQVRNVVRLQYRAERFEQIVGVAQIVDEEYHGHNAVAPRLYGKLVNNGPRNLNLFAVGSKARTVEHGLS